MNMHDPVSEASEAPDLGVVMPPSKQSDTTETQVLKIIRHKVLDKRFYKPMHCAERKWSNWGATFVPNGNALGIETAQDMIFVQQNDPATRSQRSTDMYVE
jgi:hypothetical protein